MKVCRGKRDRDFFFYARYENDAHSAVVLFSLWEEEEGFQIHRVSSLFIELQMLIIERIKQIQRKAEIISNKRKEYDHVECRRCLSWNQTASLNYLLLYSQVWQIELLSYLKLKITLREAGVAISLICLLLLNEFWELVWTRSLDGMLFSVSLYGEPRSLFSLCELTLIFEEIMRREIHLISSWKWI